jgi:hypothetical protein
MDKSKQAGGYARAKKLSPARRKEIAQKGAEARWHKNGLHSDKKFVNLNSVYSVQHISIESKIFSKLLKNQTVILGVEDTKLFKKKRIDYLLLYFVPIGSNKILVSMPGYGSETFTLDKKLKPITFMMVGLNSTLAKALTTALLGIL